jgi:methylenetetrahydrofolate dehydrogenase (NADP+) / methenyltetrahydrofolate cyclohydrolase
VRNKMKACSEVGLYSEHIELPADADESTLLGRIRTLNSDTRIHAILVQLPLPSGLSAERVVDALDPAKDVDGFHPTNMGLLAVGNPRFVPCTPLGVMKLIEHEEIGVQGRHAVVVGRSNIVGKPLALILMRKAKGCDATVTVCHSRSRDIAALTRQADIVVVAIGQARFLTADMVRPGAVVVDVGTNRLPDGKLAGDVDFAAVREVAAAITPVPGGVGPMTITMLLHNTLQAASLLTEGTG